MRNSRVLSIITEDARAVGVTYSRFGEEASVRCTREVIVAAGTVNSAKLLMLSGIGPREELDRVGIKVVADLPVGQNLQVILISGSYSVRVIVSFFQDHLTTSLGPFMMNNSHTSFHPATSISLRSMWDFLVRGEGPLTSVGVDAMGFIHSEHPGDTDPAWPDVQLMFMSSWMLADYWTLIWRTFGLDGDMMWSRYYQHLYNPNSIHGVTILPILLRPKSRGQARILKIEDLGSRE